MDLMHIFKRKPRIELKDSSGGKVLEVDGIPYSVLQSSIYTDSYWDYFFPLCYMYDEPKVLLIGLGAGTIVRQINRVFGGSVHVDAVESDKRMLAYMQGDYAIDAEIKNGDGAKYIKGLKGAYDLIMLDAYEGLSIPKQFLKHRFIDDALLALNSRGMLAINFTQRSIMDFDFNGYVAYASKAFKVMHIKSGMNFIYIFSKLFGRDEIVEKVCKSLPAEARHINEGYIDMV
ncbi:MAG: hypothetical protein QXS81_03135 [Candidatus Micrarchaeaceae archaeon]